MFTPQHAYLSASILLLTTSLSYRFACMYCVSIDTLINYVTGSQSLQDFIYLTYMGFFLLGGLHFNDIARKRVNHLVKQ